MNTLKETSDPGSASESENQDLDHYSKLLQLPRTNTPDRPNTTKRMTLPGRISAPSTNKTSPGTRNTSKNLSLDNNVAPEKATRSFPEFNRRHNMERSESTGNKTCSRAELYSRSYKTAHFGSPRALDRHSRYRTLYSSLKPSITDEELNKLTQGEEESPSNSLSNTTKKSSRGIKELSHTDLACFHEMALELVRSFPNQQDRFVETFLRADEQGRREILGAFLQINKFNKEKASADFARMLKWRETASLDRPWETYVNISTRIPLWCTKYVGKKNQPILYSQMSKVNIKNYTRKDVIDFTLALFEHLFYSEELASASFMKALIIVDFAGFNMTKSFSLPYTNAFLNIIQRYYPHRLEKVFFFGYPAIVNKAYTLCDPFLTDYTRDMITFLNPDRKERYEELLEYIDHQNIPNFLGGAADFQPRITLHERFCTNTLTSPQDHVEKATSPKEVQQQQQQSVSSVTDTSNVVDEVTNTKTFTELVPRNMASKEKRDENHFYDFMPEYKKNPDKFGGRFAYNMNRFTLSKDSSKTSSRLVLAKKESKSVDQVDLFLKKPIVNSAT